MVAIGDKVEMFRHNFVTVSWVTQGKIRKYPRVLSNKREIRRSMFGDLCVTTLYVVQGRDLFLLLLILEGTYQNNLPFLSNDSSIEKNLLHKNRCICYRVTEYQHPEEYYPHPQSPIYSSHHILSSPHPTY